MTFVVVPGNKRRTTMESWSFAERCNNDVLEAESTLRHSNASAPSGRLTSTDELLSFLKYADFSAAKTVLITRGANLHRILIVGFHRAISTP